MIFSCRLVILEFHLGSPELPKVIKNLFKKVLGSARDAIDSRTLFWEALEVVQGLIFDRFWGDVEVVLHFFGLLSWECYGNALGIILALSEYTRNIIRILWEFHN